MALDHPSDMSLAQQLAAVQEWWLDAGVDCAFVDEPQAMLREPEAAAPVRSRVKVVVAEEVVAAPAELIPAQDLPADLAAFREWWCDPASPIGAIRGEGGPGTGLAGSHHHSRNAARSPGKSCAATSGAGTAAST